MREQSHRRDRSSSWLHGLRRWAEARALQSNTIMFTLLFLTFFYQVASGRENCEVTREVSPAGEARFLSVNFPDGRVVKVVGHNHGNRSIQAKLLALEPGPDMLNELSELLREEDSKQTMRHAREDVEFLRRELKTGKYQFIGEETFAENAGVGVGLGRQLQERLLDHGIRYKIPVSRIIPDVILRATQAFGYLAINEPGLMKNVEIRGFESEDFTRPDGAKVEALGKIFSSLEESGNNDPELKDWLADVNLRIVFEVYPELEGRDPEEVRGPLKELWKKQTKAQYHTKVEELADAAVEYMISLSRRDGFTGWRINRSGQSGILFVGATHAIPIVQRLLHECAQDIQKLRRGELVPMESIRSKSIR